MIAVLLSLALMAVVFGAAWGLVAAGLRAGDRTGDTLLAAIEPHRDGHGIWLTVHNPGPRAVLLGASVRRRSLRLRCEAGSFVSVPRRTSRETLLAGHHAIVQAVAAGATERLLVPRSAATGRRAQLQRAELVLAVGEADRLRVIHRAVDLPQARQAAHRDAGRETPAPGHLTTRSAVRS